MTFPDMNKHDDRVAERKHRAALESAKRQARRGVYVKRVYVVDNRREAKQKCLFRERDTCIILSQMEHTYTADQFNFSEIIATRNVAIVERESANKAVCINDSKAKI